MKFDTRDIEKTRDELVKFNNNLDNVFKEALNEIAGRMLRAVIKKTPVDTGFLRESWELGTIVKNGSVYKVEIVNSAEYAEYVEYGHRLVSGETTIGWVDGFFMLTTTEANIKKVMDRIVIRRIEKELGKIW